jgi:hypothetical protein
VRNDLSLGQETPGLGAARSVFAVKQADSGLIRHHIPFKKLSIDDASDRIGSRKKKQGKVIQKAGQLVRKSRREGRLTG